MKRAIQVKAPAMTFADVDCRKMPGCSTSWVMLFASAGTAAIEDITELLAIVVVTMCRTAKVKSCEVVSQSNVAGWF